MWLYDKEGKRVTCEDKDADDMVKYCGYRHPLPNGLCPPSDAPPATAETPAPVVTTVDVATDGAGE